MIHKNDIFKIIHSKMIHEKIHIENRGCMLHTCDDCPGENGVREFLTSVSQEADDNEVLLFKQYIKNEKFTNLATFQLPLNEYMDELGSQLDKLGFYHFVSKVQQRLFARFKRLFEQ